MQKQLEQYFGCKVKIAEYKNKLPLPIFMTMRDIMMVEIYGVNFAIIDVVKETELSVAAMKKQKAKYEEALQCPVAYEVALNSVSMRNALVKSGVPFVDLPGNVFLPFMGIILQDVYRKQIVKADKMMPATQMVFLELLYMDDEESVLKSEVANKLNLTKTSITRATAQLEEMGLIQQMKSGTEIAIKRNYSRKEYYENAKAYLINMPNIMPHVCRHTYCSNMARAGMNPKTLQYLMGHSDISITMNTYTHLGLDDAKDEMIRLKELEEARRELEKTTEKPKPATQNMFRAV